MTASAACKSLEDAGLSCWIAPRNILPGQTWSEAIIDGLNDSQMLVLLYSAASNASPQVLREVERAVSKRLGLLAFRLENVTLSKAMEYLISVSHWQDATTGPLETHLPRLVESVQALLSTRSKPAERVMPQTLLPTPAIPTPPSPRPAHNLPAAMTSFVGRSKERSEIKGRQSSARLLTLVGPGGCGKTRLALQVASDVLDDFPEGVWLVELAALTEPGLVAQAVAAALNVKEQPRQSLLQTLTERLVGKRLLLLLDNCEHLLEPCTELAEHLLKACPSLRLLATSRAALNVAGEAIYQVPSLSLPGPKQLPALPELQAFEAVQLFVDRATLIQPTFALTQANAPAVVQICAHLDGIPLAIELAAARVRGMPVEQIARRLDERFTLLTGGARTALPRHQTLKALLDWSYALLSKQERRLLERLSVFAGGWSLEAAEKICAGEGIEDWEILDLLFSLVDKSQVVYREEGATARYYLLETVRQYAADRLRESAEVAILGGRHRDWYLALAEAAEPNLVGVEQGTWLARLETEHDNLRAALAWSLRSKEEREDKKELERQPSPPASGEVEAALRLCGVLARFWWMHGYLEEGRRWCDAVLARSEGLGRMPSRAKTLNGAGILAWYQGDFVAARQYHEQSLAISREIGNPRGIASSLNNLGLVFHSQGDFVAARQIYEESLALYCEIGDQSGIASALGNLGNIATRQGDYLAARQYQEQSLTINRDNGNRRGIALSLNNLGNIANQQGDYVAARQYYEESLSLFEEIGDLQGMALSFHNLGNVARHQGDYPTGRQYYEQSHAICREIGDQQGIANSLNGLGLAASDQEDYSAARQYYEQSHAICREIGDRRGTAGSLYNLGNVARDLGDYPAARQYQEQSLALFGEIGDIEGIALTLEAFASLATDDFGTNVPFPTLSPAACPEFAVRLWGAAEALREAIDTPLSPDDRKEYDRRVASTRRALGEETFAAAWAEGQATSLEEAIKYALADDLVGN